MATQSNFTKAAASNNIGLQSSAYNQLDYAIDTSFTNGNLAANYTSPFPSSNQTDPNQPVPHFASDLIDYAPKHRFMFRVLFNMDPAFQDLMENNVFQYVIKHIDRPKTTFDYEEVNMYNFKTKVLKTIHHEPLSITIIDDIQNKFQDFYRGYLTAYSPASRSYSGQKINLLEQSGFNFIKDRNNTNIDSAIRGILRNGVFNPIENITLIHYFAFGSKQNNFVFVNPRIIDVSYDDANHEGGDQGNHITIRFDYDILSLEPTQKASVDYNVHGTDISAPTFPGFDSIKGQPNYSYNQNIPNSIFTYKDAGSLKPISTYSAPVPSNITLSPYTNAFELPAIKET